MNIEKNRFAVWTEVHSAEEHNFLVVCHKSVAPARPRDVTVHSYCSPLIGSNVVDVEIVKSHIFYSREDSIIPTTKDDKLVLEESCRVLGSSNWTSAFGFKLLSEKFDLRFEILGFELASLCIDVFGVGLDIWYYKIEIIRLQVSLIDASKHVHALVRHGGLANKFLQWWAPHLSC